MTQQELDELSEKYTHGKCTKAEIDKLENWLKSITSESDSISSIIREDELLRSKLKTWYLIKSNISIDQRSPVSNKYQRGLLMSGLVSVLLLIGGYFYYNNLIALESIKHKIVGIEYVNLHNAPQKILLTDSSTVILDPGARLIVDKQFGNKFRIVELQGGAFFSVQNDKHKPFLVYADELVTEVLGTSFTIQPIPKSKQIEVSVVTGKVSVYTNGKESDTKKDGVIALPNHKIVYDSALKKIRHDLVDIPQIIQDENSNVSFNFNETTLDTILDMMYRSYGIEIVVVNAALKECKMTGNLTGIDMYQQLDFICEVLGAHYELRGSTIFILGSECN